MNFEDTSFISADEEFRVCVDLGETDKEPDIFLTLKESFLTAFRIMDRELRVHTSIDCFYSGTTAVALIKQGQDFVIGNFGNSRALLGTKDNDDTLVVVQLTIDLKPNLPVQASGKETLPFFHTLRILPQNEHLKISYWVSSDSTIVNCCSI